MTQRRKSVADEKIKQVKLLDHESTGEADAIGELGEEHGAALAGSEEQDIPEPASEPNPLETNEATQLRRSTRAERQEFFIPVSGFVWLYPEEVQVVNHPTFQRLGRIYQLGQSHYVYRGATHKRLEHSIGTLHVVQRMSDALKNTSKKAKIHQRSLGDALSENHEERFVRLGALLHDIGHIAAGHTVEDELGLVGKHDADARLNLLFDGEDWANAEGVTLTQLIDRQFKPYVPPSLGDKGITASQIVRQLIRKPPKDKDKDPFREVRIALEESDDIRLNVCRDMIGNTICADLLDYLYRDWYHIGKPRPFDDRILQYMEIRSGAPVNSGKTRSSGDRLVISLGKRPKVRTDAVSAILDLLEWRYQLAESVLFHKTKLAAAAMLDRALYELWHDRSDDAERLLVPLSDEQMLERCRLEAEARKDEHGRIAAEMLGALEQRRLYSRLFSRFYSELPPHVCTRVQGMLGKPKGSESNTAPMERVRLLRTLESDFRLPSGSLAMYCPPPEMNRKLAEVQISVDDEVDRFAAYEHRYGKILTGGHLDAQLARFQRLWGIHFFIDRRIKEQIDESVMVLLVESIEKLALGNILDELGPAQVARSIASSLTLTAGSPWHGKQVAAQPGAVAAFRDPKVAMGTYPFGAPSIRSFFKE